MSDRECWVEFIRNEFDPDDGAGRIADAILADKTILLRKHADEIEKLQSYWAAKISENEGLIAENERLRSQLEIAKKAFKEIAAAPPSIAGAALIALTDEQGK